jgi:protein TonB
MIRVISKNKILAGVILAHLLLLGGIVLITSSATRQFYTSQVSPVDLVEPMELGSALEKTEPEPLPPEPAKRPPAQPESIPPEPQKVTRRVESLALPPSDIKKRLEKRLSQLEAEPAAPQKPPETTSVSARKFPYSWYKNYIHSKIKSLWKRPSKSAVGKEVATALVSFRVFRDGHIEKIRLTRSSRSKIMDESVLEAARRADPLPPLPDAFRGRYEDFEIRFQLSD